MGFLARDGQFRGVRTRPRDCTWALRPRETEGHRIVLITPGVVFGRSVVVANWISSFSAFSPNAASDAAVRTSQWRPARSRRFRSIKRFAAGPAGDAQAQR